MRLPERAAVFVKSGRNGKNSMTLPTMLIATLPALLIAAAFFDLTTYTIPNTLPAGMLLLFALFLLAMALDGHALRWSEISPHLIAGGFGLAVGMAMFAAGWIGGGDAKLFAMACLWLGWDVMYSYAVIASILGGGDCAVALVSGSPRAMRSLSLAFSSISSSLAGLEASATCSESTGRPSGAKR